MNKVMKKSTYTIDTTQSITRTTTYKVNAKDENDARKKLQGYLDEGLYRKDIGYYDPEEDGGEETIID